MKGDPASKPNYLEGFSGGLSEVLDSIQEKEPEMRNRVVESLRDPEKPLSSEEVDGIHALVGQERWGSFCYYYAAERWGGKYSINWVEDGKPRGENHAAGCWWLLGDKERKEFYFHMSEQEAAELMTEKLKKFHPDKEIKNVIIN